MPSKNSLTVVIPSFNRHHEILETINSLIEVDYVAQIIIVDDFSDFDYQSIPDLKSKKIEIIRNLQNMGESYSVNIGLQYVKTNYVMILSDDDPQPKKLFDSLQYKIRQDPNFGVYVPSYIQGPFPNVIERTVIAEQASSRDVLDLIICPAGPGAVLNLRKIKDLQLRNSTVRIPSDLIQWLNLALVTDFCAVPESFAFWRSSRFQGSNKLYTYEGLNEYIRSLSNWILTKDEIRRERMYISLILRVFQISREIQDSKPLKYQTFAQATNLILSDPKIKTFMFLKAIFFVPLKIVRRKFKRSLLHYYYRKRILNV